MDETDSKIRELTEAMHAEADPKIRNRLMVVRGVLAEYPTRDAAYFADVSPRVPEVRYWCRFVIWMVCRVYATNSHQCHNF